MAKAPHILVLMLPSSSHERAFLREIVAEAQHRLALERVILFGSRARGDARPSSDFDLAFEHTSDDATWADFVNYLQEWAPTLSDLDLVDLNTTSKDLRANILRDGVVLNG